MQPLQLARKANVSSVDLRRAARTCSLGSALEYCDFALYSLVSTIILGPPLFPNQEPGMVPIVSLGTYFLGFAVRPAGGILFGSLGDRLGRKFVLLATVLLMGIASMLIGVLSTYETAGIWAPIMFIALRLLQRLGAGAEQAGAAVLMTEYVSDGKRGYYVTLLFLGIQIGTFTASAIYLILPHNVTNLTETWWRRLLFLSNAVIITVAIYIQLHLKKSPSSARPGTYQQVTESPLRNLLKTSCRNVFVGIGSCPAENGDSLIHQALVINYVVSVAGLDELVGVLCLMSAVVIGAIMVPITGWLTDRFGRVLVYHSLTILQLLITFPVQWSFSCDNVPVTIVSLSLALRVGTWGMSGAQGALLPELFGTRHRYIGVALVREVSAVTAGRIVPLVGSAIIPWVIHTNDPSGITAWMLIAIYLSLLTVGTIIATFFVPETRDRDLDDLADAEMISVFQHNQVTGTYHDT